MATKMCSKCKMTKSVSDFNKSSSTCDGYRFECKTCHIELNRQWVNNNREYVKEREHNRRVNNPQHQISKNMHAKLNNILRRGIYSARFEEIIGLNMPTYLEWLSYNFEGEMCFATYGKL